MPDISRSTFSREKHYTTVRAQMGRVSIDADTNESEDIHRYLRETTARDIIGRSGAPRDDAGFRISLDGSDLRISAGRMYVDGILAECEGGALRVIAQNVAIPPGTPPVTPVNPPVNAAAQEPAAAERLIFIPLPMPIFSLSLDGWSAELQKDAVVELSGNGPNGYTTVLQKISSVDAANKVIFFMPVIYNFWTIDVVRTTLLWSKQPDLVLSDTTIPSWSLVYLDVWQRDITMLEDPSIREVALGGPDTTTRTKTIWQVRVGDYEECHLFKKMRGDGRMAARTKPSAEDSKPCDIPEVAEYRRLENQLYRVQIHRPGGVGAATFKWSRDNGAIVFPIENDTTLNDAKKLRLGTIGLDDRSMLRKNDWVEVFDDVMELDAKPGLITRVEDEPKAADRIVKLLDAVPAGFLDLTRNPRLRVWGSRDAAEDAERQISTTAYLPLEDGVEVSFSGSYFDSGDYWLIPARTAVTQDTGKIQWPEAGTPPKPLFLRPEGITHHYAPLAEIKDGVIEDCRPIFAPITSPELFYLGGDGQEVMPDPNVTYVPLPVALTAGVSNGVPIAGAQVRFTLNQPGWLIGDTAGGSSVIATTDVHGVATCHWEVWSDPSLNPQTVTATLVGPAVTAFPIKVLPLTYNAQLSHARSVRYDPSKCAGMEVTTVQEALDELCARKDCPCTLVILEGEDAAKRLQEIKGKQRVEICFGTGTFELPLPLVFESFDSVKVTGAGAGTLLNAHTATAIAFNKCTSVIVRDLAGIGTNVDSLGQGQPVHSVFHFDACGSVTVENVDATCARNDNLHRRAGLLTVASGVAPGSVSMQRCSVRAGDGQIGIMVVEADRAVIEENRIVGIPRPAMIDFDDDVLFADVQTTILQRQARGLRKRRPSAKPDADLVVGSVRMTFVDTALANELSVLMAQADVSNVRDEATARAAVVAEVKKVAADPDRHAEFPQLGRIIIFRRAGGAEFGIAVHSFKSDQSRITIRDNDIEGAYIGIEAGFPATLNAAGVPVNTVPLLRSVIAHNHVRMLETQTLRNPPHPWIGINNGASRSLLIEGNRVVGHRFALNHVECGIAQCGKLGPFAIVRDNDISGFDIGTQFRSGDLDAEMQHQWRLITNVAVGASKPWDMHGLFVLERNDPP